MKVVIDTNVFISSFLGDGNPRNVIDLWKNGRLTLCLSQEIVSEYVEVLQRLGIDEENELKKLLQLFALGYHSIFTGSTEKLSIVIHDPDDDKFFECAVSLNAKYIITEDKAVLKISDYCGIKVVNPADFLENFT